MAQTRNTNAAEQRLQDAETRLRRLQAAIEAGADPAAFVDAINEAQTQRASARAQLDGARAPESLTEAEVYAMIDSLGDVGAALSSAEPDKLNTLYEKLGLSLVFDPHERAVNVTATPRVANVRVRGAICTLTTRLELPGAA
ncbi:MAG: hypothetical protein GEU94_17475 [Micromonosporaceae bacterium]|nr:hypothetical protein [Micromonosporaceae bacterium]